MLHLSVARCHLQIPRQWLERRIRWAKQETATSKKNHAWKASCLKISKGSDFASNVWHPGSIAGILMPLDSKTLKVCAGCNTSEARWCPGRKWTNFVSWKYNQWSVLEPMEPSPVYRPESMITMCVWRSSSSSTRTHIDVIWCGRCGRSGCQWFFKGIYRLAENDVPCCRLNLTKRENERKKLSQNVSQNVWQNVSHNVANVLTVAALQFKKRDRDGCRSRVEAPETAPQGSTRSGWQAGLMNSWLTIVQSPQRHISAFSIFQPNYYHAGWPRPRINCVSYWEKAVKFTLEDISLHLRSFADQARYFAFVSCAQKILLRDAFGLGWVVEFAKAEAAQRSRGSEVEADPCFSMFFWKCFWKFFVYFQPFLFIIHFIHLYSSLFTFIQFHSYVFFVLFPTGLAYRNAFGHYPSGCISRNLTSNEHWGWRILKNCPVKRKLRKRRKEWSTLNPHSPSEGTPLLL